MKVNSDQIVSAIIKVFNEKNIVVSPGERKKGKDRKEVVSGLIPVGISNRHVHLSQEDLDACFGEGYKLTPIKDLTQPGQFACKETVTLCGPKGAVENVRILGPVRKSSQVELLASDSFKLGIKAPLRLSGDIKDSASVTVVGPKGSVCLKEGAITAQRHIHMTPEEAVDFGLCDGQIVSIEITGPRGGIYNNVVVRANNTSSLDCHIDTEEANSMGLTSSSRIRILK